MNVVFHRTIDAYTEGIWAVHSLFSGESPRELADSSAEKRPSHTDEIRAQFAPLIALQETLARALDLTDETLRFLFVPRDELGGVPIAILFLLPDPPGTVGEARMFDVFGGVLSQLPDGLSFTSERALTEYISALPHSLTLKSALLYAYHNYDALHRMTRQVSETAAAAMAAHSAKTAPLIDAAVQFWETHLTTHADMRRAFQELQIPLAPEDGDVVLYPSLFRPTSLAVVELDGEERFYWGVLLLAGLKRAAESGFTPERVQETLKALQALLLS